MRSKPAWDGMTVSKNNENKAKQKSFKNIPISLCADLSVIMTQSYWVEVIS
jgi:hypothetical protein